jgi:hypothetical protein
MITRPAPAELLQALRADLKEKLAPELTSPQAHAALAMADLVLGHVQATVDGELRWIRCEIDMIDGVAEVMIDAGADTDGSVQAALVAARGARSEGWDALAAREDYGRSSELLSRCLEAGVRAGGEARAVAEAALEQRVTREVEIKGALVHAARVEHEELA